ncbi:MAG: hypothetical protein ACRDTM_14335 [Micromonosporaceae bacterium]
MTPYDETRTGSGTSGNGEQSMALQRRLLGLETRQLELEAQLRTQRRMLAPVCVITAGVALAFASFGLVDGGSGDLLGSWAALFLVYALVMVPLTALAVASRTAGLRGATVVAWVVVGVMAVCMASSPRSAPGMLGIGPWYLLGASAITIVGLLRLPLRDPDE